MNHALLPLKNECDISFVLKQGLVSKISQTLCLQDFLTFRVFSSATFGVTSIFKDTK